MTQANIQARNAIGLTLGDYQGKPSTLCSGCGHDAITTQIIRAFFDNGVDPGRVVKISGIGCSSKTPAYFLSRSFGFNTVHGRMPSVATGTLLANRRLIAIGISGDGDSASIGMGQFIHAMRRNIPMVYLLENNGVYGLTKGQFSATADAGAHLKKGAMNPLPPVDCCTLAIELGCGFVARSFAGDPKQLLALLKGALSHKGMAFLDVLSPCVTFNNHEGSTKSYRYLREMEEMLHEIDFVPNCQPIAADYPEGTARTVTLHDGSHLVLRKLEKDYDPGSRENALQRIHEARENNEVLTGLYYINTGKPDFLELLNLQDEPLASLPPEKARPSREALKRIMERFK